MGKGCVRNAPSACRSATNAATTTAAATGAVTITTTTTAGTKARYAEGFSLQTVCPTHITHSTLKSSEESKIVEATNESLRCSTHHSG